MRFVVYGAGAIGGLMGARLHDAGHEVVLVARGAHYEAMRDNGLTFVTPDRTVTLRIPVVDDPRLISLGGDDVVVLAMKSQDTLPALAVLATSAPPDITVVCAQNGVCNEGWALRFFGNVYGMCVYMPATFENPGTVVTTAVDITGMLDVGRYREGVDEPAHVVAAALEGAKFSSKAVPDIMRWKYTKLLSNLMNAAEAACGFQARSSDLAHRVMDEGRATLRAAGIAHSTPEEERARREGVMQMRPAGGVTHGGGSSYQSLVRATGTIESDYLNGEIALLGRLHGVPTPLNVALQRIANRLARDRVPAASMSMEELERAIEREAALEPQQ